MYDVLYQEAIYIRDYNSLAYFDYCKNCRIIVLYFLSYSLLFYLYFLLLSLFLLSFLYFVFLLRGDPYGKIEI